jgi:hypothetical protein
MAACEGGWHTNVAQRVLLNLTSRAWLLQLLVVVQGCWMQKTVAAAFLSAQLRGSSFFKQSPKPRLTSCCAAEG